jgi:hypothetical protein
LCHTVQCFLCEHTAQKFCGCWLFCTSKAQYSLAQCYKCILSYNQLLMRLSAQFEVNSSNSSSSNSNNKETLQFCCSCIKHTHQCVKVLHCAALHHANVCIYSCADTSLAHSTYCYVAVPIVHLLLMLECCVTPPCFNCFCICLSCCRSLQQNLLP